MLSLARENIARAKLEARITLDKRDAKGTGWPDGTFDVVVSNTILHHIPDPTELLARNAPAHGATEATLFLRDLARPGTAAEVARS